MIINVKKIEAMNPCKGRFANFAKNYPNFSGDLSDFLSLDNITYNDKVWVVTKMMNRKQLVAWSIACAESTKHIFNKKYPGNKCLDNLFDYLKSIKDFINLTQVQKDKIIELRKPAVYAAAYAAANAADAAADAADAAYAAADAADAAYAAANAANAAYAAAYTAYAADTDTREEQNNLNLLLLVDTMYDTIA